MLQIYEMILLVLLVYFPFQGKSFDPLRYKNHQFRSCPRLAGTQTYSSLTEAEMACDVNVDCGSVYDSSCDQTGAIHLCGHMDTWSIATAGCVIEKLPITGPIELCPGNDLLCTNKIMPTATESSICATECQKWERHFWCCTEVDACQHGREAALSWGWCTESSANNCAGEICGSWSVCIENQCQCYTGYRHDPHLDRCVEDREMIDVHLLPENITSDSTYLTFYFIVTTIGDTDMTCELLGSPEEGFFVFASHTYRLQGVMTQDFFPFQLEVTSAVHSGTDLLLHCFFNMPGSPGYGNQTVEETVTVHVIPGAQGKDLHDEIDVSRIPEDIEIFPTTSWLILVLGIATEGPRTVHVDLVQNGLHAGNCTYNTESATNMMDISCNLTVLITLQPGLVEFNSYITPPGEDYTKATIFGDRAYSLLYEIATEMPTDMSSENATEASGNMSGSFSDHSGSFNPDMSKKTSDHHESTSKKSSTTPDSAKNIIIAPGNPLFLILLIVGLVVFCLIGTATVVWFYRKNNTRIGINPNPLLVNDHGQGGDNYQRLDDIIDLDQEPKKPADLFG